MYKIQFTDTALKAFKKLDNRYQQAAAKAIERLKQNPLVGEPLTGTLKGFWKLRFSRYRIIYQISQSELLVIIFEVKHRRDVYR